MQDVICIQVSAQYCPASVPWVVNLQTAQSNEQITPVMCHVQYRDQYFPSSSQLEEMGIGDYVEWWANRAEASSHADNTAKRACYETRWVYLGIVYLTVRMLELKTVRQSMSTWLCAGQCTHPALHPNLLSTTGLCRVRWATTTPACLTCFQRCTLCLHVLCRRDQARKGPIARQRAGYTGPLENFDLAAYDQQAAETLSYEVCVCACVCDACAMG